MPHANKKHYISASIFALLSAPGVATAQCVTNSSDVTTCSGTITTPQTIANTSGAADVTLIDTGSITTTVDDQSSLSVIGFDATVLIEGDVDYSGLNATPNRAGQGAVLVESDGVPMGANTANAGMSVTNNGSITGSAPVVDGLIVFNDETVGDVDVTNSATGMISATRVGIRTAVFSSGLDVSVVNAGSISAFSSIDARVVDGGVLTVENTGQLSSLVQGVYAGANGDDIVVDVSNAGSITTSGTTTVGMAVNNNGHRADITAENSGTITTAGYGLGIDAYMNQNGDARITNTSDGTININGTGGVGLLLYNVYTGTEPVGGDIEIVNAGDILASPSAVSALGIYVETDGSDTATITNEATGVIDVSREGVELRVESGAGELVNAGTINSSDLFGAVVRTRNGRDADVTNSGDISAENHALLLTGDGLNGSSQASAFTINNSGSLSSASAEAIFMRYTNISSVSGAVSLTNSGDIQGDILLLGSTATFLNTGAITGDVDLDNGNDSMIISGATANIDGILSGGSGSDQLTFDSIAGFSFDNEIRSFETISIADGDVTFDGGAVVSGRDFGIASDGELLITNNGAVLALSNGLTNAGRLAVAEGADLDITGGGYVAQSGSETVFGAGANFGQINTVGDIAFESGSAIVVDVTNQMQLADGATFDAAISGGVLTDASGDITDNSTLFDFTKQIVDGDTLRITIEQALLLSDAVAPTDASAVSTAVALQELIDSNAPGAATISTVLGQAPTSQALGAAVNGFVLDTSNVNVLSRLQFAESLLTKLPARWNVERGEPGLHVWTDLSAHTAKLDQRGHTRGFKLDSRSILFGAKKVSSASNGFNYGAAYVFSRNDAAEENVRLYELEGNVHAFLGFANIGLQSIRLHGALGYATSEVTSSRVLSVLNETARADISGDTWFVEGVVDYTGFNGSALSIVPTLGLRFVGVTVDEHMEYGSVAAVSVDKQDGKSVRAHAGVKFGWRNALDVGGNLDISGYAHLTNEFGDMNDPYTAAFANGSVFTTFVNSRNDFGANMGGKILYRIGAGLAVAAAYDGVLEGSYQAHSGTLSLIARF